MNNITINAEKQATTKSMLDRLQKNFEVSDIVECKPGLTTLSVNKDKAETMIRELRDRETYTHLNFMTCTDYIEKNILRLTYMLHNYETKHSLAIHVDINRD